MTTVASSRSEMLRKMIGDPIALERMTLRLTQIVAASFADDARASGGRVVQATRDEIRRRTNICYDLFLIMRGDLHFSVEHALDSLPKGLRAKLDGLPWEPPDPDRAWAPTMKGDAR